MQYLLTMTLAKTTVRKYYRLKYSNRTYNIPHGLCMQYGCINAFKHMMDTNAIPTNDVTLQVIAHLELRKQLNVPITNEHIPPSTYNPLITMK